MANLESKASKVSVVIRKNKYLDKGTINSFCSLYFNRYAWIIHEFDVSPNTQEVEGVHYHLVGELKERTRLSTLLNRICSYFNFDNPFGVQVDSARCIEGCYQYLIHKNDKDKTQHDISEVVTNIDQDEFKTIIDIDNEGVLTVDRIWYIVESNMRYDSLQKKVITNRKEIARSIGIGRLTYYSMAISWAFQDTLDKLTQGVPIFDELGVRKNVS